MSVRIKQAEIAQAILGPTGAMIGHSKSKYVNDHLGDMVVFNSNIATKSGGKIWYGDINLTLSFDSIIELRNLIGEDIYVFYESDMRFEAEADTVEEVLLRVYIHYLVTESGVKKICR